MSIRDIELSVIVPVFNDWHRVPTLLSCLDAQTIGTDRFEVVLVDNGSDAIDMPGGHVVRAQLVSCGTPGSYAARNEGVRHVRGNILAFTDADCRPEAEWLEEIDRFFDDPENRQAICAGGVKVVPECSGTINIAEAYDMAMGFPQERYVAHGYGVTANLSFLRQAFDETGGFDARRFSGGDGEFCRRAAAFGYGVKYLGSAVVLHPARTTIGEIIAKKTRVKGGQIGNGPAKRRIYFVLRTLLPPVRAWRRMIRAGRLSRTMRMKLCGLQAFFWCIEIVECGRLMFGGRPTR